MDKYELSEILRRERTNQGLTIKQLAEKAGVTTRAIDYWEAKQKVMSIESADKIFKALGISITIGYEPEKEV
ncbi:helix-turn-helix transcriptional regulator [Blautia liquoris]|jgi:transcriptional regulator with XRE-family HTH domain|uniref:Helix-turn-helix transcriptional regulator n=1 Tax=Blautia liquoris TaxID=2779518 RepID=A0A7M2RFE6_9FIRM|nr:helix-turn-helix transcriptional regulator [Blautia liquoris]QOV19066.1 helix-turn-helix transcriptional regulator [Blautia liquoris]